jgi:outer membrane receptor for ferrienterochelin and colicins
MNVGRMHLKQMLITGVAGLASAMLSGTAWADEDTNSLALLKSMSLENLGEVRVNTVEAASKYNQKISDAPASVSIVTKEEIKRYGYRTLADILDSLQGFNVTYDRNYSYLGVRGFNLGDDNSRVLLLVDGHRMNNNLTGAAYIGTDFLLDVDLIDRVEVIRGPGSALYGNNAVFAVINVIPRKGGQINGVEASGEYGEYDTYKARVTAGKLFTNGIECLISGTYYNSAGQDQIFFKQFNTPAQNNGVAENMDGDSYYSVYGSISYSDLTLEGGYINRSKVNPTAQYFTTFNDSRLETVDERGYADLKFAHSFPDDLDLTARLYYDQSGYTIGYPEAGSPLVQESQSGESWGAQLQLDKRLWQKEIISAGVDYRDDFYLNDHISDNATFKSNTTETQQSYGIFVQSDFALLDELHLESGVRYDKYSGFEPSLSPRVALIYNPLEKSTFKAIYGTAFRTPNFLEVMNTQFKNLEPEEIKTYELVYEQGIGKYLNSSVAGYYNQMNNLIIFQNGNYDNINANSRGVELALEGILPGDVRGRASYSLQRTDNLSGSGSVPDSPENLVKFNLSVPLVKDKVFAGLEYLYVGSSHTVYTDPNNANTVPGMDAAGYSVLNFTLFSRNIFKNLEASVSVYNLLDQSYSEPSTPNHLQDQIPQAGRGFRLKVTYRF